LFLNKSIRGEAVSTPWRSRRKPGS
jgi:hypothetical protein